MFPQASSAFDGSEEQSQTPTQSISPQLEIAMDGCIVGIERATERNPTERELSFAERTAACDTYVLLEQNKEFPRYFRAKHLYKNGFTKAHEDQAFRDLTYLIGLEHTLSASYDMRSTLFMKRQMYEPALAYIEQAIALTAKRPRYYYLGRRAALLLFLAERDARPDLAQAAIRDLQKIKSLNPEAPNIPFLEDWIARVLRIHSQSEGRSSRNG
jgi:tetratricopeptide (TPR) repeat protein